MQRRFASAILTGAVVACAVVMAGCSSDAGLIPQDAASHDADFSVCQDTPAVAYMPGISVTSTAGAYVVTLVSAKTDFSDGSPSVDTATVGLDTWVVSVQDAAGGAPAAVTLTAERPTMPRHNHGASTYPAVTPGDPGTFTLSGINFFQSGYWEQKLNLQPASGTADKAAFAVCVL
jgi:hypothetical protein